MSQKVKLIYCGVGNKKLDRFAVQVGLLYGARLPVKRQLPFPIYFADQDWKNPVLETYVEDLKIKKPKIATVLDWERLEQEAEVLNWVERIAPLVDKVVVIPKVSGIIDRIPLTHNGAEIILGYSVPTKYGATTVPIEEFANRKIHFLGGSPKRQIELYDIFVQNNSRVVSVDCNYISMKATRFCEFWTNKKGYSREWVAMKDVIGKRLPENLYTAFFLSCVNYINAWNEKLGGLYTNDI